MFKEKIKKLFKNIRQSDDFEPLAIRRMRRYYLIFTYVIFSLYFGYIIYSVVTAPTVISQDEDTSRQYDSQIPNVYFFYDGYKENYTDYNLTIDCIYYIDSYYSPYYPKCSSSLLGPYSHDDPGPDYVFKPDPNTLRFGSSSDSYFNNDPDAMVFYMDSIYFLINYTASPALNSSILGGYMYNAIYAEFVDPEYNFNFADLTPDNSDIENEYSININNIVISLYEDVDVRYSRTILTVLNTAYDWLNRLGIYISSSNNKKTTLNIVSQTSPRQPNIQPKSVLKLSPSTFTIMRQKETYTQTFISTIGSLSGLVSVLGVIGVFLFGSERLQAFGYLHRRYRDQYKQLLHRDSNHLHMTFEDAIESLSQGDRDAVTDVENLEDGVPGIENQEPKSSDSLAITTPFELSGPELQIRILSNWF